MRFSRRQAGGDRVHVAREAQGSCLGSEAVRDLIDLIFNQTDVDKIVATTDGRNTPAHRLLARNGFVRTDTTNGLFGASHA
jgi:RimJ/RimL family protein N-acetyltransferase